MEKTLQAVENKLPRWVARYSRSGFSSRMRPSAKRSWFREPGIKSRCCARFHGCGTRTSRGGNIYIRPKGEHQLSLVDDLGRAAVIKMKQSGFTPAVVVETSPGNYQAWLRHPQPLNRELSTATARALAMKFGGDLGAADWRHFGRLAGFTNRKWKYQDAKTGLFPFVRVLEAAGMVYPAADKFVESVRRELEERRQRREATMQMAPAKSYTRSMPLKTIDSFRADARYGGDGTRIDLAYSIYALSHGVRTAEVAAAIRSRDLSHKGNERRQGDYVDRTIKKALAALERNVACRAR